MATSLRAWVKQQPTPYRFLASWEDGSEKTIRMGESRSRFRDAEEALKGACRVEALDREGDTLRVWSAVDAEGREGEAAAAAVRSPRNETLTLLTTFARLLQEGSDRSAERHAEAFRLAYEQQALLVQTVTQRLASLETMLHDTIVRRVEEVEEREDELAEAMAGQEPGAVADPNTGIVTQLLTAAFTGGGGPSAGNTGEGKAGVG